MNGLIKYLLYLLVALLLISWIFTVGKSCNSPEVEKKATSVYEITEEATASLDTQVTFDEEIESILDEEAANGEGELQSIVEEEEELDYSSFDPKKDVVQKEETKPAPKPKPKKQAPKPVASSSGRYLVVTGSYIHPDNANKQKRKLSNLGYSAEVVVFDLSQYHTVLAGRYSDYDSANSSANALKNKGYDCYVKKQTF